MAEKQGIFFLTGEDGLIDSTGKYSIVSEDVAMSVITNAQAKCEANSVNIVGDGSYGNKVLFTTEVLEELTYADPMTVDFWVKIDGLPSDTSWTFLEVNVKYEVMGGEYDDREYFTITYYPPDNEDSMRGNGLLVESIIMDEIFVYAKASNYVFTPNTWTHIAVTTEYNSGNSEIGYKLYIDGVLSGQSTSGNGSGYVGATKDDYLNRVILKVPPVAGSVGYLDNIRFCQEKLWTSNFDVTSEDGMFYKSGTFGGSAEPETVTINVTTPIPNNITKDTSITISGTAPSDTSTVTWENKYGDTSGNATGTEEWVAENIPLVKGLNKIKITASNSGGETTATGNTVIKSAPNYNKISYIYRVESTKKENLRGKAAKGYVRPTLGQLVTSKSWEPLEK